MSQSSRKHASDGQSRSRQSVQGCIAELTIEASRFVPPARVAETVHRWLDHGDNTWGERDPAHVFATAMTLATDLVLFTPASSGATAIDRLARQRKPASADEATAMDALRQAQFRLARVGERASQSLVQLHDLISGEHLRVVDEEIPSDGHGLCLAVRTGPLRDGSHILIGPITPLDDAALSLALGFTRAGGKGLSNPQRCAEAVYRHVLRHGGIEIPGLNALSEEPPEPEDFDLADIAMEWARLKPGASPPDWSIQRVRELTCLDSLLDTLAASVLTREDSRDRLAGAYALIASTQIETIRRREAIGMSGLTLTAVSAAVAHEITRHGMPAAVRTLFEELKHRGRAPPSGADSDPVLERLIARIQALRAKTVAQGCTEEEALAAAEKVAELLDRYGLSLDAVDLRRQACQGLGIETGRRRLAPIDDCIPSIATFFDCRAWTEKGKSAPLRHIFFGLRPDVEAAHYLYDLIALAFATETDAFARDGFCAALAPGERRSAAHSFQIGLARGIIAKLHRLRTEREAALSGSSGRDLVPIKTSMVDDELARLGLHFRRGGRASRRRVDVDAYSAGHEAGSRFEIRPGLTAAH